jgi:hypothetical protein
MVVNETDRLAMAHLIDIMNGKITPAPRQPLAAHTHEMPVQLGGAGQVTNQDIQAMASVLQKFNQAVEQTHVQLLYESKHDAHVAEALVTEKQNDSVKIGHYKIAVHMDEQRVAGKQYYDVVHGVTGEKLASELSLYEAAHGLVKLLNSGKYVNHTQVRDLLEAEAAYTSHRIDAIHYHKLVKRASTQMQLSKVDVFEARKAASMDKAAHAKIKVKRIYAKL